MPRLWELYLDICVTTEEKVRVVEKCPDVAVAVAVYTFTHKQYAKQHNETARNILTSKKIGKCGPCPVFASYTLAFALHLRKKHLQLRKKHKKNKTKMTAC
jgi:predicted RNA-binding protein associated with RNAse of E/G family